MTEDECKGSAAALRQARELKYLELRTTAGANAIRVPGIISAAAIAVILGYLSNMHFTAAHQTGIYTLIVAIALYLAGVLASSIAAGFSYLNQVAEHEFVKTYGALADGPGSEVVGRIEKDKDRLTAGRVESAKTSVKTSYAFFIVASIVLIAGLVMIYASPEADRRCPPTTFGPAVVVPRSAVG